MSETEVYVGREFFFHEHGWLSAYEIFGLGRIFLFVCIVQRPYKCSEDI